MRRIFPLKSASSASNHHGQQQSGGAGSAPAPISQKESSRLKASGVSSRHSAELSRKSPVATRSKKTDPSSSEDVISPCLRGGGGSNRREHWCPGCPTAAEHGGRCDTPPSGDENIEGKEVEKGVISHPSKDLSRVSHRQTSLDHGSTVRDKQALDLQESFKSVTGSMRGVDSSAQPVDKYTSKRSGLGAVDNLMHERTASKPAIKSKAAAAPPAQEQTVRSTSAPKVRAISRSAQLDGPRVHSMRIMRVPDRVFEAAAAHTSSESPSPRVSDGSSSTDIMTPRTARAAAYEKQRLTNLAPVKTHSRAQSLTDGLATSRPPLSSPSFGRKAIDSPRTARKEVGMPAASSGTDSGLEKSHTNKYSGARVVAERLAKAFRGTSRAKDGKASAAAAAADVERRTGMAHSRRTSIDQQQQQQQQQQQLQLSDASYDGSCSDTSSMPAAEEKISILNVLQLVKPGEVHSQSTRKESAGGRAENVLTWQEFVADGRLPQSLSNDNPAPEGSSDSSMISRNSVVSTGSRRWASAGHDDNKIVTSKARHPSPQHEEKEREILKAWLEGLKRQSDGMTDDLEMKARMAEQRLAVLNGEQSLFDDQLDFLHELQVKDDNGKSNLAAGINIMQQRIRRMHEEKKRLALEVASEVKRRITERAAAKEVLVMMKREMEACVRVMEKEKLGMQSGFDRELERRENDWSAKLENIKMEEKWLRERVRRLEEEKGGLQSELDAVALKEGSLREKVRDFELQMDGHRKRVEGAEKTILDLRQSLVSSCQQARQAESDMEVVRKAYVEKESQSEDLAKQVERLQQLCADHESSIEGLQQGLKNGEKSSPEVNGRTSDSVRKELVRLSEVERSLREELEALRSDMSSLQSENKVLVERLGKVKDDAEVGRFDQDLQAELASLHLRTAELQDENKVLSYNLKHTVAERETGREILRTLESNLSRVEEDSKALQDEAGRERIRVQEKEREIHRLERRVDGLLKNNQMLQGILAMREKAALISDEDAKEKELAVKEAHQLESEMRESLQVSARQLSFMNERAELMNEKLKERDAQLTAIKNECGKKDEVIRGLEQSLGDLAKSVDAQNRRIMHLTSKNGELSRHLQSRGKEVEDLHSKIVEDSRSRMTSNHEIDQISVQAHDAKQELEAQNLLCKLLRDKLAQREEDLSKRCDEITGLIRSRDWLQAELKRAQSSIGEASQRLANLERTVRQQEELMSSLRTEKDEHLSNLSKLREVLPQVEQERDEMQGEAEEIGREALRLSAEVEVLRRKVAQLEEDVMVKEGQISILRGGGFGGSETTGTRVSPASTSGLIICKSGVLHSCIMFHGYLQGSRTAFTAGGRESLEQQQKYLMTGKLCFPFLVVFGYACHAFPLTRPTSRPGTYCGVITSEVMDCLLIHRGQRGCFVLK